MTSATPQPTDVVATALAMPPSPAVVFRSSAEEGLPATPFRLTAPTPASLDPLVASDNLGWPMVVAVVTRTGRDLSALSSQPWQREWLLLPGTTYVAVPSPPELLAGVRVLVLDEVVDDGGASQAHLPPDIAALMTHVRDALLAADERDDVPVPFPGRFTGPFA
jgi:hypothetical protein